MEPSFVRQLLKLNIPIRNAGCNWNEFSWPYRRRYAANKPQIVTTDRMIDQRVYELYGLTDKEIALVEEVTG